ncbi:MAG: hypothetical protein AB7O95_13920 [Geminicoccaceae bacterium]
MTAARTSKTVTAGTTAASINVATEFGGAELAGLVVTNRSVNEVAVHCAGGTAAIDGDDCLHIPAGASRPVPYPVGGSVSYIAAAAGSKVEFAYTGRSAPFMR